MDSDRCLLRCPPPTPGCLVGALPEPSTCTSPGVRSHQDGGTFSCSHLPTSKLSLCPWEFSGPKGGPPVLPLDHRLIFLWGHPVLDGKSSRRRPDHSFQGASTEPIRMDPAPPPPESREEPSSPGEGGGGGAALISRAGLIKWEEGFAPLKGD